MIRRLVILLSTLLFLSACGFTRKVAVTEDTKLATNRVEERGRATRWTEDIRIIYPQPGEIPGDRDFSLPLPPDVPIPHGTIIEIRRTETDVRDEVIAESVDSSTYVDQKSDTEASTSSASWMLTAFVGGLALALAIVVYILIRIRR